MDLLLRVLHVALQVESSNELGHLATPQQPIKMQASKSLTLNLINPKPWSLGFRV